MKLSARNQLVGTVKSIKEGGVMAEVVVDVDAGSGSSIELTSVITATSAHNLQLAVGSRVTVVIKSTEVLLATDD